MLHAILLIRQFDCYAMPIYYMINSSMKQSCFWHVKRMIIFLIEAPCALLVLFTVSTAFSQIVKRVRDTEKVGNHCPIAPRILNIPQLSERCNS